MSSKSQKAKRKKMHKNYMAKQANRKIAPTGMQYSLPNQIFERHKRLAESIISPTNLVGSIEEYYKKVQIEWLSCNSNPSIEIKTECGPGCPYCCYARVDTSVAEVLLIRNYMLDNFDASLIETIKDNIERIVLTGNEKNLDFWNTVSCPLLIDNKCSIYTIRPFICCAQNSMDRSLCEYSLANPEYDRIPSNMFMKSFFTFAGVSLCARLREIKIHYAPVELTRALHIALNEKDIVQLLTEGKANFTQAEMTEFPPDELIDMCEMMYCGR